MREALLLSIAQTPIGKAFRGALNDNEAPVVAGHGVVRTGLKGAEIDNAILDVTGLFEVM